MTKARSAVPAAIPGTTKSETPIMKYGPQNPHPLSTMRTELEWDVLFVLEHDDLRRARDIEHFRLARELGRTLITLDRDFADAARFPPAESPGVIICIAGDEAALVRGLRQIDREWLRVDGVAPLRGQVIEKACAGPF